MSTRCSVLPSSLLLLVAIAPLTAQQAGPASRAHAEAHANASGGESRSSTHRVVVVDGRTVVDERSENGRPVGPGGAAGRGPLPPLPPLPSPGADDTGEMLRRLQEEVRRLLEQQGLPPQPTRPATPPRKATVR